MFENCFKIEKWTGKKTDFHKKYYVFDGVGSVYFDTLLECRQFIRFRCNALKYGFNELKKIFKTLSHYYVDKVFVLSADSEKVRKYNTYLYDVLDYFSYLIRPRYYQHYISYTDKINRNLLSICKMCNYTLLEKRLKQIAETMNYAYPAYYSTDYKPKTEKPCQNVKNANNLSVSRTQSTKAQSIA